MFFTSGWIKRLRKPKCIFPYLQRYVAHWNCFVTLNTLHDYTSCLPFSMWVSKESLAMYHHGSWCARVIATSFSYSLYMEMKRSFMLFPLVALFIAVCRFISWFHLRFCRLFWGKPLKCVSDSKQSSSRFPAQLASSPCEYKRKRRKK